MGNDYDIVGDELVGDELVGDELVGDAEVGARRMNQRRGGGRMQAPAPQQQQQQRQFYGLGAGEQIRPTGRVKTRFQKMLGASPTRINPGGSFTFTITPTVDFRGERLVILRANDPGGGAPLDDGPMPAVLLSSFKVGNWDQIVGGNGVSIDAFREDAVGLDLKANTCPPNQNITITIQNGGPTAVIVQPSLFGSTLE